MSNTSEYEELTYDENEAEWEGDEDYEEEPSIYYSEDFISGPMLSKESTLPGNILEFDYSFGYDCKRYYNMTVADEKTIIFASGNLINFFNVETKEFWFRRSAFGGGIGHITKNPNPEYPHIAVGENGVKPPIIVYDWPSLDIICLLKEGTSKSYSHLSYSPDGMLLVSQGGEPDFLITIFNWAKSRVLLRTKSNVNEVYRVMFSPDVPGQLTSCGLTHIKFWKMAQTFTGLKLQGELGRFGKTEYCDILGVYPMPDEKVISGSTWGNILVWDEGLIKLEVCRKLRKKCHDGPITQFYYYNGDLWSVGMDGRVRVWFYDTIDQADPPDDDRFVQVEPIYDFYTPNVILMCIYKQNDDPKDMYYFAQDGNGGLWKIDLDTDNDPQPAEQLYMCHAGAVVDIAACPWGPYLASLGIDGRLQIYQYVEQKLLFTHSYPAKGTCMIWLPLSVQSSGNEIIMGFDDGNLRVAVVSIDARTNAIALTTIQITKPHNKPVTKITINDAGNVLVSGGEDATIFIYKIKSEPEDYTTLVPIGYIFVPGIVTYLTWHHNYETVVLVGCIHGQFVQVDVPTEPQSYTTITYILHLEPIFQKFVTYKAQIRRDIKLREIEARKAIKLDKKREELEKVKKENPGLDIDEEVFLADSESEEVLAPLHIPEVPNRILWMRTTEDNTIWLSMSGYDAGYIYEYYIDQATTEVPAEFQIIYDGDDIEISSYVYSADQNYLILAMEDGSLRVVKVNPNDWRDWSDYWQLSMHDNYNGFVPKMCFSHNEVYFFTCGHDGNIFSYKFCPEEENEIETVPPPEQIVNNMADVEDVNGYTKLSLEEAIVQAEIDRVLCVANERKRILREKLTVLRDRFEIVLERNENLQPTQVIPRKQLEIDPRITAHLEERLSADLALVKRKLAFQVEKSRVAMEKLLDHFTEVVDCFPITVNAVQSGRFISTTRQRKLTQEFNDMLGIVEQKIIEEELKGRPPERAVVVVEVPPPPEKKEKQLEYFLIGLSPSTIELRLGAKLKRLLNKYRMRKSKIEKRQEEWDAFNALEPEDGINDPDDEVALNQAMETIGDFKLKSAADYKVPHHLRESTVKKYKQLLLARLAQHAIRKDFNESVYSLRDQKVNLRSYLLHLNSEIDKIHEELSEDLFKFGPQIPEITESDFNEKNLEVVVVIPKAFVEKKEVKPKAIVKPPKGDLLEKEVLTVIPHEEIAIAVDDESPEDFMTKCIETDTPWEIEVRDYRQSRKLFYQSYIINKMQKSIENFDDHIVKLIEEKLQVAVNATVIDIHILTLHQELIILKDFESVEDKLQEKVHAKMEEMLDMQDVIRDLNNKIDWHKRKIDELLEMEKEIQQQFFMAVTDNKFYDFLRRIFKKKYKPPKVHGTDDDSSSDESSSSSDESEEDDAGSIDSRDFGIIRLDENVCPKGCDLGLYNLTFELRNKRHGVELDVKDQRALIENLRKDLEMSNKKNRLLENHLKVCQTDLEAYQREKQRKLNEVMCTVVLKMHQLQHLISENESNPVRDTLVFSQTTLSKLYKRVGELYQETLQQKAKHKSNITHLCRMKTDCKHMQLTIEKLKKAIIEKMKLRFGREVDLNELEEVQLKRMVMELRLSLLDIKALYEKEIQLWKTKYGGKQVELAQAINDNTARLELLALMNTEKTDLAKIIELQKKKRDHFENVTDVSEKYREDLEKLTNILKNQEKELFLLREETKRLGMKAPPPPRIYTEPEEMGLEEEDMFDWQDWSYETSTEQVDLRKEEELAREKELGATDLDVSSLMHEEIDMIAKSLILEMLESLECFHEMSKTSLHSYIENILEGVLKRRSVMEIVDNLIALLPIEPDEEQQAIIETTAEQIFALLDQALVDEDIEELADKILSRVPPSLGASHSFVANMIMGLVEKLPIEILRKEPNIDLVVQKMKDKMPKGEVDKEELVKNILERMDQQSDVINSILNEILEKMFGIGIDYLYYIKL